MKRIIALIDKFCNLINDYIVDLKYMSRAKLVAKTLIRYGNRPVPMSYVTFKTGLSFFEAKRILDGLRHRGLIRYNEHTLQSKIANKVELEKID